MSNDTSNKEGFIPPHGGYRNLITYQKSEIVYDGTQYFTKRFFQKYDRTIDQMVQAARSGKQKYCRSQYGICHFKGNRNKTHQCSACQFGRVVDSYATFQKAIEHESPEICANTMITLITITTYLLKQQIKQLETAFINEGGLRERMTKARLDKRNKKE
jgi:four helix bundle suffix protein